MKVGVALGSGSARGFAHIGILEYLQERGVHVDVVAGTSIGAIVGASYACGNLDRLKAQALNINRLNWTAFFNPSFSFDGWINLKHMQMFLVKSGIPRKMNIEDLKMPFGTVTCDLNTGKELWVTEGPVFDAVWPSMAMPGVFQPVLNKENRWCIDGGIVNPVPVSLCRALGADVVIAVNLNSDLLTKNRNPRAEQKKKTSEIYKLVQKAKKLIPAKYQKETLQNDMPEPPDFFETIASSINIAQDRITKTRLAGDPPEVTLQPKLSRIGLLETYRAEEAIAEGRRCCELAFPQIIDALDLVQVEEGEK